MPEIMVDDDSGQACDEYDAPIIWGDTTFPCTNCFHTEDEHDDEA